MQQYFCSCTARIWDHWLNFNLWCFGVLSLSGLGGPFFFPSLVPLPGVFSFIYYLFHIIWARLIHALALSLVSFFLPLFPCPVFFPLFIYFTLFPTHICPCTLSSFFFSSLVPLPCVFSFIYLFHISPDSYMPLYSL